MNLTINTAYSSPKNCTKPQSFKSIRTSETEGLSKNARKVLDLVMESTPFRAMEKSGNIDILSPYNTLKIFYRNKQVAEKDFGARVYSSTIPAKAKEVVGQLEASTKPKK